METPKSSITRSSKHGGPREGAGRKTVDHVSTQSYKVTLDAETVKFAKKIGNGNMSYGIRVAVKNYQPGESK